MGVGFWLYVRCILVVWSLDLDWVGVGFGLCGRWILLNGCWILVVWTLDFDCLNVGF